MIISYLFGLKPNAIFASKSKLERVALADKTPFDTAALNDSCFDLSFTSAWRVLLSAK